MKNLKIILSLGSISHGAVLRATGHKAAFAAFGHGKKHKLHNGLLLIDSYHCSRYNINTGTLTADMFDCIIMEISQILA